MRLKRRITMAGSATALSAAALIAVPPPAAFAAPLGVSSDFNGDGYSDQVIGAPTATVSGKKSAGYVAVVYGSSSGLNRATRQIFHQDSAGIQGAAETGDQFGYSTAAGDYDGDGFADLLIGSPGEDLGAARDPGTVTFLRGGPSGLTGGPAWSVEADSSDTLIGRSLAAGDFNHDGYADFAIAGGNLFTVFYGSPQGAARAPQERQARQTRQRTLAAAPVMTSTVAAGDVNKDGYTDVAWQILNGDHNLLTFFLGSADDLREQSGDMVYIPGEIGQAIADVNGDGYGDLISGRPYSSGVKGGAVSIRPGTAKGLNFSKYYTVHQNTSGVPGASEEGDGFGYSVAAKDLNGDGRAEIAVGVQGEDKSTGMVVLLRGSSTWTLGSGAKVFTQNTSGVPGNNEAGDRFGRAVAFNDPNHDNRPDLVIGVAGENAWDGSVVLLKGAGGTIGTSGAGVLTPAGVGGPGRAGSFGASLHN
ncbi:FG-GAP-like repeat-containing protein [Actinomadura alba]|uniref:FG-GAP repeat protein n=1 Tax=Actinomadura alba TaxID=406431 RepID=A0ABR7LXL8_9ACTN|nr:FG-GAP-like repeat-containing protein [Actinomadura alba]MBC6469428.1 FG-GAP repeat protein [Actinomadura alba]